MPTVEERLASLEGRVNEHTQTFAVMRDSLALFRDLFEARFTQIDQRFTQIDQRLERVEARVSQIDEKLERRMDHFDDKMTKQFVALVAVLVTSIVGIASAVLGGR